MITSSKIKAGNKFRKQIDKVRAEICKLEKEYMNPHVSDMPGFRDILQSIVYSLCAIEGMSMKVDKEQENE